MDLETNFAFMNGRVCYLYQILLKAMFYKVKVANFSFTQKFNSYSNERQPVFLESILKTDRPWKNIFHVQSFDAYGINPKYSDKQVCTSGGFRHINR